MGNGNNPFANSSNDESKDITTPNPVDDAEVAPEAPVSNDTAGDSSETVSGTDADGYHEVAPGVQGRRAPESVRSERAGEDQKIDVTEALS